MKKILLILALCAVFIFIGCGGTSDNGNEEDNIDTENSMADEENKIPDACTEAGFEGAVFDEEGEVCVCPGAYNFGTGDKSKKCLPVKCSAASSTPCVDLETDLIWSGKYFDKMDWSSAVNYCQNLAEGKYYDWRMPTISELRTLIQNCKSTETDGKCSITDSSHSYYSSEQDKKLCAGCPLDSSGKYSKLGDADVFWSCSVMPDADWCVWNVGFDYGDVLDISKISIHFVRCVRNAD